MKRDMFIKKFEDVYGWPFIDSHKKLLCELTIKVGSGSILLEKYKVFNKQNPTKNIKEFIKWYRSLIPLVI